MKSVKRRNAVLETEGFIRETQWNGRTHNPRLNEADTVNHEI